MSQINETRIPSPPAFTDLQNGAGMRVALRQQHNHCEEWDEARDQEVIQRAEENAKQLPEFAKLLRESYRKQAEAAH